MCGLSPKASKLDVRRMGVADVALNDCGREKGDRSWRASCLETKAQVRLSLTWPLLLQGRQVLASMEDGAKS